MDKAEGLFILREACRTALLGDRLGRAIRRAVDAADRGDAEAAMNLAGALVAANPESADASLILASLLEHGSGQRLCTKRPTTR